jgi:hypothetical protein
LDPPREGFCGVGFRLLCCETAGGSLLPEGIGEEPAERVIRRRRTARSLGRERRLFEI